MTSSGGGIYQVPATAFQRFWNAQLLAYYGAYWQYFHASNNCTAFTVGGTL
jgi:hypothetical protein